MTDRSSLGALPPNVSPTATRIQFAALGISVVGILFGLFCVYGAAYPGPCGDNPGPGLGVLLSWLVDAPLGLLILAVGFFVRRGLQRLRGICVLAAIVTLSLPVLANFLLQRRHCP